MFKQQIPIGEITENASKPVIINSLRKVLEYFDLLNPNIKIFHNGENETVKLLGSLYDDKNVSDTNTDMNFIDKFYIVSEVGETEFNSGYGNSLFDNCNLPFWYDKDTGIKIRPISNGTEISVDVNCHFSTRQDAINFVNEINLKRTKMLGSISFSTRVHYPLNMNILSFLVDIYKLKHRDDFCLTFPDFFEQSAVSSFSIITNLIGNHPTFVFDKEISETTIMFNDPTISRTKPNSTRMGRYEVSFAYKFYWNDITHWDLEYPFLINQRPIPSKYVPKLKEQIYKPLSTYGFTELMLQERTPIGTRTHKANYVVMSPTYDYFRYSNRFPYSLEIQVLMLLSKEEELGYNYWKIFNINDNIKIEGEDNSIHPFVWDEVIYETLIENREYLFKEREFFFNINILSNQDPILFTQLEMDDEGNIYLLRDPFMKHEHRFMFYTNYDFKNYSERFLKWICDNSGIAHYIIQKMLPWREVPDFTRLACKEIKDIIDDLGKQEYPQRGFCNGMMGLHLIAHNSASFKEIEKRYK